MIKTLTYCWLILLPSGLFAQSKIDQHGAIIRSDTSQKKIYLCFTGHDFDDGFSHVLAVLDSQQVSASFFLTGDFVRSHRALVQEIAAAGHFVGAHSDKHLLYCDWRKRDSLLHSPAIIRKDIQDNLLELAELNIHPDYFMPPFEWHNQAVVEIAQSLGQLTVNFSPGTYSNADYTTPDLSNYLSSTSILERIYTYETQNSMNGFHLLIHPGVNPRRVDKLYLHLTDMILYFRERGYGFARF
jgi:peptidoglycan/xylan/chitin deacetylase (PgdA/CDA1 family)